MSKVPLKIAIVGGGAAGFFCALRVADYAREKSMAVDVRIFEYSDNVLKKVRISGGGRCNVTHFCFDPKIFANNYPRGGRELLSAFNRFQARDTVEWFRTRNVFLNAEEDGRMFPSTNSSQTIIDCFLQEAKKLGVKICTRHAVQKISKVHDTNKFNITFAASEEFKADNVLIATGSSTIGYELARSFNHHITELAPSLFSFNINDPLLKDLSGLSFEVVSLELQVNNSTEIFKQSGPLLITHWGLSGPATLKLSAWAAREMKTANYIAKLRVNWLGAKNLNHAVDILREVKDKHHKMQIGNAYPPNLPKRFWQKIIERTKISETKKWAEVSKKELDTIGRELFSCELEISGKSRHKDEFVECGGVDIKEIDFRSMQSKICEGLYFAGEILDIDGITGGFNFQNAWTGGWIAGTHMIDSKSEHQ